MEYKAEMARMTRALVASGVFEEDHFSVLDVGCSGGLADFWNVFGSSLQAVGIDPVIAECERLGAKETRPNVRYRPAFVGLPPDHPFVKKRGDRAPTGGNPWSRLSTPLAMKLLAPKTKKEDQVPVLNDWVHAELADSNAKVGVDQLVAEEGLGQLDFIKVDVDGYDLDVIFSAVETVRSSPVLGFTLEVNFYGTTSETDHTFHNTDKLMREWGFDLFGLTVRTYSASVLPGPFIYDGPAQTTFGRPYQGDAVYLRDPLATPTGAANFSPVKLLKLACLFECFGLPDHAAEILLADTQRLLPYCNPHQLLDLLAKDVDPSVGSYTEYLDKFLKDPTSFYPSHRKSNH